MAAVVRAQSKVHDQSSMTISHMKKKRRCDTHEGKQHHGPYHRQGGYSSGSQGLQQRVSKEKVYNNSLFDLKYSRV